MDGLPKNEGEHVHVRSVTSIVAIYTSRTILVTQTLREELLLVLWNR